MLICVLHLFQFCYILLYSYYLISNLCDKVFFFHYMNTIVKMQNYYYKKHLYFSRATKF